MNREPRGSASLLSSARPLRIIVCGTTFGRIYLEAIRRASPRLSLAGVLSRGGARSRACADSFGVPLFTDLGQVPKDVDAACVVVRSGVVGGQGSELAQALLARGLHVLQEQPAHHDEVAACLRAARKARVHYQLNPFYRHVEPVRDFLTAAQQLRSQCAPLFVEATSSIQVLFPLVDILGQALGGLRPWAFAQPAPLPASSDAGRRSPFTTLEATIAGIPTTLRIQNELDPRDPDNHAHCLHRVTVSYDGGRLSLVDTHGPVLWHPRLHVPRGEDGVHALDTSAGEHLDFPSFSTDGMSAGHSFRNVFSDLWPNAVNVALSRFADDVERGVDPLPAGQLTLSVCKFWQDLTAVLGRPRLVHYPSIPRPLPVESLQPAEVDSSTLATRRTGLSLRPAHSFSPRPTGERSAALLSDREPSILPTTPSSGPRAADGKNPWVRCYRKLARTRLRLICFPHAGGSASVFRGWPALLPDDVELWAVQYPGREERLREPLVGEMEPLVDAFLRAIAPDCDRPFALFGHSMGATIAYEAAGRLEAMGTLRPLCLFVSGQCAPADHRPGAVHRRDDAGLIAELERVGGAQRLLEEPELCALMLPIVRSDYRLIETYRPGNWILDCPVVSYGGDADPDVNLTGLARWSAVTNGEFDIRTFSGDHFYLAQRQTDLVADVSSRLTSI